MGGRDREGERGRGGEGERGERGREGKGGDNYTFHVFMCTYEKESVMPSFSSMYTP